MQFHIHASYTWYEVEDLLAKCSQVKSITCRKSYNKEPDETHIAFIKSLPKAD